MPPIVELSNKPKLTRVEHWSKIAEEIKDLAAILKEIPSKNHPG